MTSYLFDIGDRARKASRFIGTVRSELQYVLSREKAERKLNQQDIATLLGVNRSVVNRQLIGTENLTLRSVADLAWALGWDIDFRLRKRATRATIIEMETQTRAIPIIELIQKAGQGHPVVNSATRKDNKITAEAA
jgi:predicted XRE-type DNA-binding protein